MFDFYFYFLFYFIFFCFVIFFFFFFFFEKCEKYLLDTPSTWSYEQMSELFPWTIFHYVIVLKFPQTLVDKCCLFIGVSGTPIQVITNYFNLEQAPDWHLYQYHVDFNPTSGKQENENCPSLLS